MEHAMDGGPGGAIRAGELGEALTMLAILKDGGVIEIEGSTADMPSFETGAAHAGAHPLDDQASYGHY
jgi:formylmethanofuran dehydrogenase subunit C